MKKCLSFILFITFLSPLSFIFAADVNAVIVTLYPVKQQQLQKEALGTITLNENAQGVILTPHLNNLPSGLHGFRYLPGTRCEHIPTSFMQPVMDPKNYPSFLAPLAVDHAGKATSAVIAPKLTLAQFNKQVLIIYGPPLEYPDQQFPYVAGTVIACGVVP